MDELVKCKRVVFLGAPGCGKGTQSAWLKGEAGFVHLSTGDLLREAVAEGTDVGKHAKDLMARGHLVPDAIVLAIVEDRLRALAQNPDLPGFILDGFPRTVAQAEGLGNILSLQGAQLDAVMYFDCPDKVLRERVCGRRVHPASGRTYHTLYHPPKVAGIDDLTGDPLVHRADDNEEAFSVRLETYKKTTEPLITYYEQLGVLHKLAAERSEADVRKELKRVLMLQLDS